MKIIDVDDTDSSISYSGSWSFVKGSTRQWGDGSVHSTTSAGSTARFTFTGSSVQVWVTLPPGSGQSTADYSLDGNAPVRIAQTDGSQAVYNVMVFSSGAIPNRGHTLTITNRGSDEFRLDRIRYNAEDDGSDVPATGGVAVPAPAAPAPAPVASPNPPKTSANPQSPTTVSRNEPGNTQPTPAPPSTISDSGSSSRSVGLGATPSRSSGSPGLSGVTGASGLSGLSGVSGASGASGAAGASGVSGGSRTTERTIVTLQTVTRPDGSVSTETSVTTVSASADNHSGVPIGAIIGGVLGAVIALLIFILLILLLRRRRQRFREKDGEAPLTRSVNEAPRHFWSRNPISNVTPYNIPPPVSTGPPVIPPNVIGGRLDPKAIFQRSSAQFVQIPDYPSEATSSQQQMQSYDIYSSPLPAYSPATQSSSTSLLFHPPMDADLGPETIYTSPVRHQYLSGDTIIGGYSQPDSRDPTHFPNFPDLSGSKPSGS